MPGWITLIRCGVAPGEGVNAEFLHDCHFEDLIELIKNAIQDLVLLSTLIVVAVSVVIGFKLLTSGGNENAYKESRTMAWKVVKGYVWILAAWVIVYTITSAVLKSDFNFLLGP